MESLGQGLVYEDMLPLRWRSVELRLTTLDLARLQDNNEEVLRIIAELDEHLSDTSEEHAPLSQEMLRIKTKENLLLGMVGQLFTLHYPQPPTRPIKLSPHNIEWVSGDGSAIGEYGEVELYLSPRCPRPLVFPGAVTKVEGLPGGNYIQVEFAGLSDGSRERLEKLIGRRRGRGGAGGRRRARGGAGGGGPGRAH